MNDKSTRIVGVAAISDVFKGPGFEHSELHDSDLRTRLVVSGSPVTKISQSAISTRL